MPRKICALRKTPEHQNVYTKPELVNLAVKKGYKRKDLNSLKKENICALLNIKWVEPRKAAKSTPAKKITSSKRIIKIGGVPCNVMKTKLRKEVFTKPQLADIYKKHFNTTLTAANKLTKTQICSELNKAGVRKLVLSRQSKAPVKKTTPKRIPIKKAPVKKTAPKKAPSKKVMDCISRSGLKLKKHQINAIDYLMKHRGVIAAHGVGSGKTLTAVAASQCILDENPRMKIVVVTPTSLQKNFKKEMVAYGIDENDKRYSFYTHTKFAKNFVGGKGCTKNTFLIIDEAHFFRTQIKGNKGKSAQSAVDCAKKAGKILLLTATPIYNDPKDILNLVAMVKGKDPLTRKEFEEIIDDNKEFSKYFGCIFSIFKSPKSADYPSMKEENVEFVMDPKYYKEYRKIEKTEVSDGVSNPWAFMSGLRTATLELEPCYKCEWIMEKIMQGRKTVLFSSFVDKGINRMKEMFEEEGIDYVEVTGKMTQAKRNEAVEKFNDDNSDVKIMIISEAGGEGLDLKGVRDVIIMESGWNRAAEMQIIGRAVRYKSHAKLPQKERNVTVYYLMVVKPVEGLDEDDNFPSADTMLRNMTDEKQEGIENFLKKLERVSFEKYKC